MYKYVLNCVVKTSMMFAKYFEYYTIRPILSGAVFSWTRCTMLHCIGRPVHTVAEWKIADTKWTAVYQTDGIKLTLLTSNDANTQQCFITAVPQISQGEQSSNFTKKHKSTKHTILLNFPLVPTHNISYRIQI